MDTVLLICIGICIGAVVGIATIPLSIRIVNKFMEDRHAK